jgi:hypothetical protein
MRYNWETPLEKLPPRLRRIVEINNEIFTDNWIDLTPEERSGRIKDGYGQLADLRGKLNRIEIDYLEDANYHGIMEFLAVETA